MVKSPKNCKIYIMRMTIEQNEKQKIKQREWSKVYYHKKKFEINKRRAIKRIENGKKVNDSIKAFYNIQ